MAGLVWAGRPSVFTPRHLKSAPSRPRPLGPRALRENNHPRPDVAPVKG